MIIISLNFVSAANYKLLCINKGETIQYSKCNPGMSDRTCQSDFGCQHCVSIINGNYCPTNPNFCNIQSLQCTYLSLNPGSTTEVGIGISGTINVQNTTYLNITDISTNPQLPINNNGNEQVIKINFNSNIYPINASIKLYNSNNNIIDTKNINEISKSSLPLEYSISSSLTEGQYKIRITLSGKSTSVKTISLGDITISEGTLSQTNNSQNQNTEQNNQNSRSNYNSQPVQTSKINSPNTSLNNSYYQNTSINNNNPSKITGAIIGTTASINISMILLTIFLSMILLFLIKKSKNKSKDNLNEFKVQ